MHNIKEIKIEVGDLVLIKDKEKNNRKWSVGIDEELYKNCTRQCYTRCLATNTNVIHGTTNSVFVSTRTSLRYEKIDKYIQEHKL